MYLKELRINGFKSFADSTRLDLHPGLTAIVGPNGCGKSNIADAIRWVLGEQSSKSLRAGTMAEVIFQGTTSRKPLNLCEVSLLFTDCEKQLGVEYAEVEVTRRVTREGGSDYFLNGKSCRLRDIQRLFLDTGVGQVSYSFMLQGQIDKVLSSNPQERRAIFEEAAGISKYKSQRREALGKLTQVEANLARVTDVMEEVARQMATLKRQAAKALRYRRIKHRLDHLELALAARRAEALRDRIAELEAAASQVRERVASRRALVDERESLMAGLREGRDRLNGRLQEAQQTVFSLRAERDQVLGQAELAVVRAGDARQRISEIERELAGLEAQRSTVISRLEGETQSRRKQMELFSDSDEVFQRRQRELVQLQNQLDAAESAVQQSKHTLLMAESGMTRLRSNCTTLEVDLKTYQVKHSHLTEELRQTGELVSLTEAELGLIREAHAARTEARSAAELEQKRLQEETGARRQTFRAIQADIQKSDREVAQYSAQVSLLEGLQEKLEGFSEGAKAILQGRLDPTLPKERAKALSRHLRMESAEYTPALEAMLGSAVDALVLDPGIEILPVVRLLGEGNLGRACFQHGMDPWEEAGRQPLPAGFVPACSVVSSDDEGVREILPQLLAGCYFVPDLECFLEARRAHPQFRFELVATLAGDLVDRRGWIYGGPARSRREGSFLQRTNEIKRLRKDQARMQKLLDGLRQKAAQEQTALEQTEARVEEQRRRVLELAQEVSTCQAQERAARQTLEQAGRRSLEKRRELEQLERSREDSLRRLEKANSDLQAGESAVEEAKSSLSRAEEQVVARREERDRFREQFNETRLEISEKRQRLAILDRGLEELHRQNREIAALTQRRRQEMDTLSEQIGKLESDAVQFRHQAEGIDQTLRTTMQSLETDRVALLALDRDLKAVEENLAADRGHLDRDTAESNRLEVQMTREMADRDHLSQEVLRNHQVQIESIDWRSEIWQAGDELAARRRQDPDEDGAEEDEPPGPKREATPAELAALESSDWDALAEEAGHLRGRLQAMGPVNLVAIEEFRDQKERHQFLKTQSDDLWQSKEKLVKAIDDINQTSQQLFAETFSQIRRNFSYTFETLFGGGSSDLLLVDTGDVLESGIEIVARPPGTRLRSLGLLSGGQKTMTAVALLFAIYMVKPSPFCVLDEIDAPLDDANIGRFCDMLKSFLQYSQFVIITHNKRTISHADTIYGATMQERGVSKVVSMRFDRVTDQPEVVPG